jgi:hypothetical protein
MGLSSQAMCHASLRAHVGPPSKRIRIMTTGGRHDPSESSDPDVRPTQGADDGVRGTSVGKDFESGCAGGAWDALCRRLDLAVPQIQMLGARQNDEHLSGRRRLAKALDLAVSPRPAADCPGLGGLRRTRATIGHVMSTDLGAG